MRECMCVTLNIVYVYVYCIDMYTHVSDIHVSLLCAGSCVCLFGVGMSYIIRTHVNDVFNNITTLHRI